MAHTGSQVISGQIVFDQAGSSFSNATISIRLEDVSLADAPSRVVAEEVIRHVSLDVSNPRPVAFSLEYPELEERARYTLSVHVHISANKHVTPGDYITMQSYPVPARGAPARMTVHVRPVR